MDPKGTRKRFEENLGVYLYILQVGKAFLNMTLNSRRKYLKKDKFALIKM